MIKAKVAMRFKDKNGKWKFGKPEIVEFKNRAELNGYLSGVMKGAKVKVLTEQAQGCGVSNPMMQRLCGYR